MNKICEFVIVQKNESIFRNHNKFPLFSMTLFYQILKSYIVFIFVINLYEFSFIETFNIF